MSGRPLRDRLRETARPPERGLEPLARLEQRLLGETAPGIPLRQRLERLVRVAVRSGPATLPEPVPPRRRLDFDQVLPGSHIVENEHGRFLLVQEEVALDRLYGEAPLSRLRTVEPRALAVLAGEPAAEAFASFDPERTLFLDTETTGLAGGAGTAAFLVGLGRVEGGHFVLRQYLMRDYDEEKPLLHALSAEMQQAAHLVTFNGRGFDLPLLEARFRMNRTRPPLPAVHLDLLPPARRLWGERFDSCRLQALEAALLGLHRGQDVPSEEIPRRYFDYLRSRDARGLLPVLEHNRYDVISLASLLAFCCRWLEEAPVHDPRDHYGLARTFERAAVHERSEEHYRCVVAQGEGSLRLSSLRRLAARAKRACDHAAAVPLWDEAARAGAWWALRELAIHHEHRSRELVVALAAVEEALREGAGRCSRRMEADLRRRRARLQRKMAALGD